MPVLLAAEKAILHHEVQIRCLALHCIVKTRDMKSIYEKASNAAEIIHRNFFFSAHFYKAHYRPLLTRVVYGYDGPNFRLGTNKNHELPNNKTQQLAEDSRGEKVREGQIQTPTSSIPVNLQTSINSHLQPTFLGPVGPVNLIHLGTITFHFILYISCFKQINPAT